MINAPDGEPTITLEGVPDPPRNWAAVLLAWVSVISSTLFLRAWWIFYGLAVSMAVHLGALAWRALRPVRRLLITPRGVCSATTGGPAAAPSRWHLYDEVRIEAQPADTPAAAAAGPRWRLVIVNAYKPSISTYLHRRGTDAPIFAPSVEHVFAAPAESIAPLRGMIEGYIAEARRRYRAIDLKTMDLAPPDPELLERLRGSFELKGTPVASRLWIAAPVLIAAAAAALLLLASRPGAALGTAAAGLLGGIVWYHAMRDDRRNEPRRIAATLRGLEIDDASGPPRLHQWDSLHTVRAACLESGRWRLAIWSEPIASVRYSEFLFTWMTVPPVRPVLDILVDGDEQTGELICREIERRARAR